jgi:teichuronic acid biosynthesis glycosyltransferase TuaC
VRVLTFTNLYPNPVQPRHGIFVEHRTRQLAASGRATVRVVAPVPWVPSSHRAFGRYAVLAQVPSHDERSGISISHPRFLAIPKLTGWLNPLSMALGAMPTIARLRREGGDFDLIDAHFVYPDGAAAVLLGAWLGKAVVVTARGTDVNEFLDYRVPRAWIRWVARRASALVTVSAALRERLLRLPVAPERVTVLRNGVDLELFKPLDRERVREELGLEGPLLLSVGHLLEAKGHQFVIEALQRLPGATLVVVGEGPMRDELQAVAERCGVAARVKWTGNVPHAALARYYAAADVTVLASKSEGMPNVLLESLACGTPVIATNVGGNAEVVSAPEAGVLMEGRSTDAVVDAYHELVQARISAQAVRGHAERFGWAPTTHAQLALFESILQGASGLPRPKDAPVRTLH